MFLKCIIGVMLVCSLAGCATVQKSTAVNHLQVRVAQMTRQLEKHDQDVAELKHAFEKLSVDVEGLAGSVASVDGSLKVVQTSSRGGLAPDFQQIFRVSVTPQEVQEALKISGYYEGVTNGKFDSDSQKAIKAFQRDHGLESDGIVGKRTWAELKNYLE